MIHQWIYVIIPVFKADLAPAYFVAYCKGCNWYFSEPVPLEDRAKISWATLPRDGCSGSRAPSLPPELEVVQ